jgi:hypothetical protein
MRIEGLPQKFWVVVRPSPHSTLRDILFSTDFSGFAKQIRGGLHESEIAGIYAEEPPALALAKLLLNRRKAES